MKNDEKQLFCNVASLYTRYRAHYHRLNIQYLNLI